MQIRSPGAQNSNSGHIWAEILNTLCKLRSPSRPNSPDRPHNATGSAKIGGPTSYRRLQGGGGDSPQAFSIIIRMRMRMMMITGGTHRHQPLRYILGGAESHPPWVPVPKATHFLRGQVPKYCCLVGTAPGQSSVCVSVSVSASVSV